MEVENIEIELDKNFGISIAGFLLAYEWVRTIEDEQDIKKPDREVFNSLVKKIFPKKSEEIIEARFFAGGPYISFLARSEETIKFINRNEEVKVPNNWKKRIKDFLNGEYFDHFSFYFAYKIKEKLGELTKEEKENCKEAIKKVDKMKEKIEKKKEEIVKFISKSDFYFA